MIYFFHISNQMIENIFSDDIYIEKIYKNKGSVTNNNRIVVLE
jgi:hypothetical protein